jgi:radical SAM protein with 4Fe4S-binding SPASM domain
VFEMVDIIRYEPFFGRYLFANEGDLYSVDGPIESAEGVVLVCNETNPFNGLSVPAKVQIQVTNRCNLGCSTCYVDSGEPVVGELSDDEIRALLRQCQRIGVLQIQWSGGDPFVRKGFVQLMRYAHELGFEQDILTNGVAIGRREGLASEVWQYVRAVQVSMDGCGESFNAWVGKNVWETVIRGVKELASTKSPHGQISVATTLDVKNVRELQPIAETLRELGIDTWLLARQVRNGRSSISEEEADALLAETYPIIEQVRALGTEFPLKIIHPFDKGAYEEDEQALPVEWVTEPAARTFLYVSANGDVYPFPYYDGFSELRAGNIRQSSVIDLWRGEPFTRMRSVSRRNTGCGNCGRVCQLWSRWFNYGRHRDLCEPPIDHVTCPMSSRG